MLTYVQSNGLRSSGILFQNNNYYFLKINKCDKMADKHTLHREIDQDLHVGDYLFITSLDGSPVSGGHCYHKHTITTQELINWKLGIKFKTIFPTLTNTSVFKVEDFTVDTIKCSMQSLSDFMKDKGIYNAKND